jgi:hypothetical protein
MSLPAVIRFPPRGSRPRWEDKVGLAHCPIGIDFPVNDIKVSIFIPGNLDADSDVLVHMEYCIGDDSLSNQGIDPPARVLNHDQIILLP